jgi:feruloyl esterase
MGSGTTDLLHVFMAPGMFQCGDGPGPNSFDTTGPLTDRVEHAKAPDSLIALKVTRGKTVRSRPLYVYPAAAKYKGTGRIDDAAGFTRAKP